MVTDRDPAPVCLFSLRGQAWLPARKSLIFASEVLESKPEVGIKAACEDDC